MHMDEIQFSELTTLLYGAALNNRNWSQFLRRVSEVADGAKTFMFGQDIRANYVLGSVSHGFDPDRVQQFETHFGAISPWKDRIMNMAIGQVSSHRQVCPPDAYAATEFYNDWMVPQGDLVGGGLSLLFNDAGRVVVAGAHYEKRRMDRHEEPWIRMLRALVPNMQHAMEMARVTGEARLIQAAGGLGFGRDAAVLTITRDLNRLVHANRQAHVLLEEGGVARLGDKGTVAFVDSRVRHWFEKARSVSRFDHTTKFATFALTNVSSDQKMICHCAMVDTDVTQIGGMGPLNNLAGPGILITLHRVSPSHHIAVALRDRFGLTPKEAEVAVWLAYGQTMNQIAEMNGTSVHTVRSQLKSVLSKAGVNSQLALVALINRWFV